MKTLSKRISQWVLELQRKVADELNFRTRHQSPQDIFVWLLGYCLLTGSILGYILYRAIFK